jgi:hypothetical protein
MPTVLRVSGFRVVILFPPREHKPAHVHVISATGVVVITLANAREGTPQLIRKIDGMSRADVRRAERIVAEHADVLWTEWRRIWGS